jgi:uncharacterized membrane-anchored protein YjiN (DUF445 family)
MDKSILIAIITASGSIVVAALSFYLTKRHQIKTEWQKEKLIHYKELLTALSELVIDGYDKDKANIKFASAANTIALVASQDVITALMTFHDEVKFSNKNKSIEKHDRLLKELLLKIRQDIDLSKKDDKDTFIFHLIGSAPGREQA